ncbi:type VI secretion system tip protein VgrG [Foetidibacter luteolus]|uniref:type VI secretion system tip protein VgrG n=1 Tax=Foetidibacter luteolus TaxID=2608880 RepID=UPI00129AFD91|nr:type VI secretion system tip protein VgrG [Foetidibacter luteolus]
MAVARTIPTVANPDLFTCTVKVDGQAISREYQVSSISVHKEVNKIPWCKLRIIDGSAADETFAISDKEDFVPGKTIEVAFGYHTQETTVFKGLIIKHSNTVSTRSSDLLLECRDAAVKMTIGRNSRHFNDVTDSDVAEELIGAYAGVTAEVEATAITHKNLVQFDTTDWDFIVSRMDLLAKICVASDGVLAIKAIDLAAEKKLDVLFGATIYDYRGEIDARNQYKAVEAASWDYTTQEVLLTDAQEPSFAEPGNISNTTLAETTAPEKFRLIHSGKLPQEQLQAWADAKLLKNRLSKIRGTVKFQGFPDLLPGDFIGLNGVGQRFNGNVIVSAVHHEASGGNWSTEVTFGLEPGWFAETVENNNQGRQLGLIAQVQGLQVGIVTQLQSDPDAENRIKVRIPVLNSSEEGVWARVATLDAGNNRGTFFLPEIGDEVIVAFINNDPNHAVVLGMLNSSAKPAPLEAKDDNHEKGYVSRSGMKMIFNDDEKSFKLETPAGKKITLSEKDNLIQVEDENGNKIKMEPAGVEIESSAVMKLKAGGDLTIEAVNITLSPSANFAVGSGGAEISVGGGSTAIKAPSVKVEGSGITEIKGGLVKIN